MKINGPAAVTDIAAKMREVLPTLKAGLDGVHCPELRPECEENWNRDYAIIHRLYYDAGFVEGGDYFDHERFKRDYEKMVRNHFPRCKVTFYWKSQEIEVCRA